MERSPDDDLELGSPRRRLLKWFASNARDLPWRRTRDPYAVWVSEIMLQQTRVQTVIPYYERFLERFPDPASLARAAEDEVLSMWSGLGYYRRARLLHRGVKEVVEKHGGMLPRDAGARLALPGIGRYTAGAIGSIAFGQSEPIVDGNVSRVLARLVLIETAIGQTVTEKRLWSLAARFASGRDPGALNQALMELGATVCLPSKPHCDTCPLRGDCAARASGKVAQVPVPRVRRAPRRIAVVALLAEGDREASEERWLVRGEGSLFGGLWGCPMVEGQGAERARELAARLGLRGTLEPEPLGELEHVLTHRHMTVSVYRMTCVRAEASDVMRRVVRDALAELGVSRLTHKILDLAEGDTRR